MSTFASRTFCSVLREVWSVSKFDGSKLDPGLTSGASYAQLVGAVALAMLLGGVPAGVAATVVGWGLGAFILEEPSWSSVFADRDELLRWSTSLLAAAVVVAVGWAMRRGHERTAVAAVEAER